MIDIDKIRGFAEEKLKGTELFVVDVNISQANEIEVLIDSDTSVGIDSCVELSKALEAEFDREEEDFSLTVSSSGIGQPLKVFRQYRKLIGHSVEVLLKDGVKIVGVLRDATPESIMVSYEEKILPEGKKRKEIVEKTAEYKLDEVKTTKEHLDFK